MKLNFRMTLPEGGSISMSTDDPALNAHLEHSASQLVYDAFERGNLPFRERETQRIPEILSDETLDQIERLERALEGCRNRLIDLPEDAEIGRLLDMADEALGYTVAEKSR